MQCTKYMRGDQVLQVRGPRQPPLPTPGATTPKFPPGLGSGSSAAPPRLPFALPALSAAHWGPPSPAKSGAPVEVACMHAGRRVAIALHCTPCNACTHALPCTPAKGSPRGPMRPLRRGCSIAKIKKPRRSPTWGAASASAAPPPRGSPGSILPPDLRGAQAGCAGSARKSPCPPGRRRCAHSMAGRRALQTKRPARQATLGNVVRAPRAGAEPKGEGTTDPGSPRAGDGGGEAGCRDGGTGGRASE